MLPVRGHDDDAIMFLHLRQQLVYVVAAVLLPVLKNGFALIKEEQRIMNLGLPAEAHTAQGWTADKHDILKAARKSAQ